MKSNRQVANKALSYLILSYLILSYLILSYLILSYLILSYVCGFYEATQRLSCNYTIAELIQFDGRARGDDVMGNLTVSK